MDLELDHVIVFVPGPDAIEPAWFPGCTPALLLLRAALERPELPFVAIGETAGGSPSDRWPSRRTDPAYLHHRGGARDIRRATVHSRALPDLGAPRPRDVAFAAGPPRLRLEVDGVAGPWTIGPFDEGGAVVGQG